MNISEHQKQMIANLIAQHTYPKEQLGFTTLEWLVNEIVKVLSQ